MSLLELLILALAAWRAAYFLVKESGPFAVMDRVRNRWHSGVLTCAYCASVWTALVMFLLWLTPLQHVVYVLAISGAALMLASYSGVNHGT